MPSMLVTCPETAHLEEIDYEDSSAGLLVASCSGFASPCSMSCGVTCAALLDRKRRAMLRDDEITEVYGEDTLVSIRI